MPDTKDDLLKDVEIPLRDIDFQVDTLQQNNNTWAAAYFSPSKNTITTNYRVGRDNSFNESDSSKSIAIIRRAVLMFTRSVPNRRIN